MSKLTVNWNQSQSTSICYFKGTRYKSCFGGFKTDITHDHVLGISVNISTKAFCPLMCVLFVCSESCFYTFGRIDWVGWRLARGEDGRGWSTRGPQEIHPYLVQNECDSSPFDHQSILMKDHFMGTVKIV